MTPANLPLRDDLRGLTPYGAPQIDVAVRLNTNENTHDVPGAVVDSVVAAISEAAGTLNRYPDREAVALREALAQYVSRATGLPVGLPQVWAANGSNEILQQLMQAFGGPGRRALGFVPSYTMHQLIATVTGTGWVSGQRGGPDYDLTPADAADQVAEHRPGLVFLCSPNNPTGTALDPDVVEAVLAAAPRAVVVVDEAYAEFTRPGVRSAVHLLAASHRLVVTRTMSKAFAFAGARLGYLVADPAVADAMRLVRLPYHLSALTQAAAVAALGHADILLETVAEIVEQRDRIAATAAALGFRPVASDANFVLIGGFPDARLAWQDLLADGILVRDVGIPGHLRVTAGTAVETDAFLTALSRLRPVSGPVPAEALA